MKMKLKTQMKLKTRKHYEELRDLQGSTLQVRISLWESPRMLTVTTNLFTNCKQLHMKRVPAVLQHIYVSWGC